MPIAKETRSSSEVSEPATPKSAHDHAPLATELLQRLYGHMLRARLAQDRLKRLKRRKGHQPAPGREAIEVGCAIDVSPDDVLLCPHNSLVAPLVAGIPLPSLVLPAATTATEQPPSTGYVISLPTDADSLAIAAGIGYGFKLQKKSAVVFALDAGTTPARGVEAVALLARDRLPVIAVIENRGGHPERLLASARQHKIPIITVDANDVVAVYRVAREALHRARNGRGSTVIDCYPLPLPGDRSTNPLTAMEHYMQRFNCWSDGWREGLEKQYTAEFRRLK